MENKLYLKEVSLSGYKSIIDVTIEFQKGINVIIGKNAAGKTNFLRFLNKLLTSKYDELNNFTSKLSFFSDKQIILRTSRNIEIEEFFKSNNLSSKIEFELKINNKLVKDKKGEETSIFDKFRKNDIIFDNSFLCHGIPNDYFIVDKPFSFVFEVNNGWSNDLHKLFSNTSNPYFVKYFTLDVLLELMRMDENFDVESVKNILTKIFKNIESINQPIQKYSPIEEVRFSKNFNVFISEDRQNITVNNLFLEFKIEGNWLPYSNLSDGTKRLFYIISEVYDNENNIRVRPTSVDRYSGQNYISRIILIEEPELGIHPHQFHKLLEFLKEESENKQIIITTHSPQALDAIKPNELDRIIIAYSTNSKEGTKLRHLNENEIIKANEYIKEDFLSDYWLYSDLEK
jgi:predicted ATPase